MCSFTRLQPDEVQTDWKEESELVVSVVKEGSTGENSMFLTPSSVTAFLNKCPAVNCDKVVETLAQKLASQDAGVVLVSSCLYSFHSNAVIVYDIVHASLLWQHTHGNHEVFHKH